MTILLIVEKNGNIKETNVKNVQVSELYKKAGFKSAEGFEQPVVCWPRPGIDPFTLDYQIQVFGKTKGRAGQENKYDFPPPIDSTLFFGSVVLVAVRPGGVVTDLTNTAWEMIYEQLFGGFEDLVDSQGNSLDDEDSEEEEELEGAEYTKEGYVKDDFIVDDDEDDGDCVEDTVFRKNIAVDSEDDSEFELPKTRKNKKLIKEKKEKDKKEKKEKTEVVETSEKVSKSKKSSSSSSESEAPILIEETPVFVIEPSSSDVSEEEVVKPSKKQRKPRVLKEPKAPKEPKVKKVKEPKSPKEKAEPKKKFKRGGKKDTDDFDSSESVYVPMDTTELEEETYI
jgi:hypothetical protein